MALVDIPDQYLPDYQPPAKQEDGKPALPSRTPRPYRAWGPFRWADYLAGTYIILGAWALGVTSAVTAVNAKGLPDILTVGMWIFAVICFFIGCLGFKFYFD